MNDYLFSAIIIAAAFISGSLLYFVVAILIKRWGRAVSIRGFRIGFEQLRKPLQFFIPVSCLMSIMPLLRLPDSQRLFMSYLINIVFIALSSWVIVRTVNIFLEALLSLYDIKAQDNLQARRMHTQFRMIARIIAVVIILLTISFILMSFLEIRHIGVTLLASAGILGIIIGFAAQKTLGNMIVGIQIAIAQPIRLDDAVIIEDEWGWIEEINLTYVVVRIWDLRRLIVPISYFLEKPFQCFGI